MLDVDHAACSGGCFYKHGTIYESDEEKIILLTYSFLFSGG
jgi:hypothetical protein